MKKLLQFEFRKLCRQKSFYICMAIMLGMLLMTAVLLNALQKIELPETDGIDVSVTVEQTSTVEFLLGALPNASFVTVAGIFAVLFVSADHEQQILKNVLARGYSRKSVCTAKLIVLLAAATAFVAVTMLAALGIGAAYYGKSQWSGKVFALLGVQYAAALANVTLAFAIASIIRKTGAAIAGVIVLPSVVDLALSLVDSYLKLEKLTLSKLWLSSFMNEATSLATDTRHIAAYTVGSLVYIAPFAVVSIHFSEKNEL